MTAERTAQLTEIQEIGSGLAQEIEQLCGCSPLACLQCTKCSSGCPVAARTDITPHQLVRLLQTGQRNAALSSGFIWECTSCHTCITRCPQQVDICGMNDALRALSLSEGLATRDTAVPTFNKAFLDSVRKRGRVHELGLMAVFKLRTGRFFEDMGKAPMMLTKGKLPLFGHRVSGRDKREELFRRAAASQAASQTAASPRGSATAASGEAKS